MIKHRRLRLFGHIARSDATLEHCYALRATIHAPPCILKTAKRTSETNVDSGHAPWNLTYRLRPIIPVCTLHGVVLKIVLPGVRSSL